MDKSGVIVFLVVFAFLLLQVEACIDKNRRIKIIQMEQLNERNN